MSDNAAELIGIVSRDVQSRPTSHERPYFPETDSLYIELSERPSVDSRAISDGVVLDYDSAGDLVGIDIDNASGKVELKRLILSNLPGKVETITAWPKGVLRWGTFWGTVSCARSN